MKVFLISVFLMANLMMNTVHSDPDQQEVAKILEYEFENDGTGPYHFKYLTSDGQSREEQSEVEDAGTDKQSLVIRGSYSYTGPDGIVYTVTYTADHNGFHPEGEHIKVPPFIPWPKGHYQEHHNHDVPLRDPVIPGDGTNQLSDYVTTEKPQSPYKDDAPPPSQQYLPTPTTLPPTTGFQGYPSSPPSVSIGLHSDPQFYTTPRPQPYVSTTYLPSSPIPLSTRRTYRQESASEKRTVKIAPKAFSLTSSTASAPSNGEKRQHTNTDRGSTSMKSVMLKQLHRGDADPAASNQVTGAPVLPLIAFLQGQRK